MLPVAGLPVAVTVAVSPPTSVDSVPQRKLTVVDAPLALTVPLRVADVLFTPDAAVVVEVGAVGAAVDETLAVPLLPANWVGVLSPA